MLIKNLLENINNLNIKIKKKIKNLKLNKLEKILIEEIRKYDKLEIDNLKELIIEYLKIENNNDNSINIKFRSIILKLKLEMVLNKNIMFIDKKILEKIENIILIYLLKEKIHIILLNKINEKDLLKKRPLCILYDVYSKIDIKLKNKSKIEGKSKEDILKYFEKNNKLIENENIYTINKNIYILINKLINNYNKIKKEIFENEDNIYNLMERYNDILNKILKEINNKDLENEIYKLLEVDENEILLKLKEARKIFINILKNIIILLLNNILDKKNIEKENINYYKYLCNINNFL